MKKYKLIKEYPGSPKLKTIWTDPNFKSISNYPEFWEEIIDKNPLKLEVGKEYILQYVHSKSKPQHVKITHFTEQGYPWQERVRDGGCRGIVSPNCYKLIEEVIEYPVGTKAEDIRINTVITKKVDGWYKEQKTGYNNKDVKYSKHIKLVKEIIEKDYEILSVITNDSKFIEKVYNQDATIEPYWKIHSIKRLSDGEIFTIRDKVTPKTLPNAKPVIINEIKQSGNTVLLLGNGFQGGIKHFIIKKPLFKTFDNVDIYEGDSFWYTTKAFTIYEDYCNSMTGGKIVAHSKLGDKYFSTRQAAQEYINSKKPLFTTEDGVDIFEGDEVYYTVAESFFAQKVYVRDFQKYFLSKYPNNKRFSTKEAAENFIILNKPCLSLNDVGQFYKNYWIFQMVIVKGY